MQAIIQTVHRAKPSFGVLVVLFIITVSWLVSPLFGQQPEKDATPTILFVCEHGAAKSVMAAAYFDQLAQAQGLKYKAVFRGTHPDPALAPAAEQGLHADGFDTSGWKPALVSSTDMTQASRIIALGCALPEGDRVKTKLTDWNDLPSPSQDYAAARAEIKRRVQRLVAELAATTKTKTMNNQRIFAMVFAKVYPMYVQKVERKNRTKAEVDQIICWLTGYDQTGLQQQLAQENDFETFFAQAPAFHPNSALIKGVVCGIRVEAIEDPLMQRIRYLDKLIDELAKGKAMEKILRQ